MPLQLHSGVPFRGYRCYRSVPDRRPRKRKSCHKGRNSEVPHGDEANLRNVRYAVFR